MFGENFTLKRESDPPVEALRCVAMWNVKSAGLSINNILGMFLLRFVSQEHERRSKVSCKFDCKEEWSGPSCYKLQCCLEEQPLVYRDVNVNMDEDL